MALTQRNRDDVQKFLKLFSIRKTPPTIKKNEMFRGIRRNANYLKILPLFTVETILNAYSRLPTRKS